MKFISLKYKLLCYSIIVSFILTVFISIIEINYDIRMFKVDLNDELSHFEKDHSEFLSSKVWELDYASVKRSAANEVENQIIDKITITDIQGRIIADTGIKLKDFSLKQNFDLVYFHNGKKNIIGHVFIGGNIPDMYEAINERWQSLFIINGILIVIIFFFFYALFYRNVLSRLIDITGFTNQIDLHSEKDLKIYQVGSKKISDEMTLLAESFNNLIQRIKKEFAIRKNIEATLEKKNKELGKVLEERYIIESSLIQSEERYRALIEDAPDLRYRTGMEGKVTFISQSVKKYLGYTVEEAMGMDIANQAYAKPKEREKFLAELQEKNQVNNYEVQLKRKDGTIFWGSTNAHFYRGKDDKILGIEGVTRDITQIKQAEKDFQTIVESTIGIIGHDYFDKIVVQICEWLDCECAIVGEIHDGNTVRTISMIMDGQYVKNYSYPLKGSPCDEAAQKCYCAYPNNVSSLFPDDADLRKMNAVGYVGAALENRDGRAVGIICGISRREMNLPGHTRDILKVIAAKVSGEIERIQIEKEKDKLESKLQQSQRMETIGVLAGGIAHDFNNMLFPIVGHTEMLLENTPEGSPIRDSLGEIYTSALRARDLVKQILTFSRQESCELKLMKMQPVIEEALKLIRSSIPATIEIKQHIDPECGVVKADPTQIHQVVMNLTTNAYHAMEGVGGELRVSLAEIEIKEQDGISFDAAPGAYACLKVADTGKGMNEKLKQKIFDPFFTTKEKGKGTGMGLSVVHGIVKSMEGTIQVYSEPGKGTEFKVYFPIEKGSFDTQRIQHLASLPGGTEQILLVDDEEAILTIEKQILKRLGYRVISRTSSIDALEAFRADPAKFDLVITDMAMPNMSGDKLSAELVKIRADIPILLCTGFSETMSEEKAASLGIKGFLFKPISMKDFSQKIHELLGNVSK
ncbi:MAG: ATP-binding protein [Desulfobacula sp.]|nr:ATP-binding protein [Desulfobacula sp.]